MKSLTMADEARGLSGKSHFEPLRQVPRHQGNAPASVAQVDPRGLGQEHLRVAQELVDPTAHLGGGVPAQEPVGRELVVPRPT